MRKDGYIGLRYRLWYPCGGGSGRGNERGSGQAKLFEPITQGTWRYIKSTGYLGLAQTLSMQGQNFVCIDRGAVHNGSPEQYCGHNVYQRTHSIHDVYTGIQGLGALAVPCLNDAVRFLSNVLFKQVGIVRDHGFQPIVQHDGSGMCSELITCAALLDYITDFDWDYLRIEALPC
jgi:hypothetical protein